MKIEKITEKSAPGYPSFNDHRFKRRSALKIMLGGLLAIVASGCGFRSQRTGGVVVGPTPVRTLGKPPAASALPLEPPAAVDGDMIMPAPQEPEPVAPPGLIAEPVAPPKIMGKMAPVQPPEK